MYIKLPKEVKYIIDELENNGYEANIVGGCVRDSIMGVVPKDWDITTNALPEEVKSIFKKTIDTGIKHGTVSVLLNRELYEVTTYRIDGEYKDNRHPENVKFTKNLMEDLRRRDFTINAIAYNDDIYDPYNGIDDIYNKVIRCVGVPKERFEEDALRILRAVRFSAKLNFKIEDDTLQAMYDIAPNLSKISKERIRDELVKTLMSNYIENIQNLLDSKILKYIFDDIDIKFDINIEELVSYISNKIDLTSKIAIILYYLKLDAKKILQYLRFDNKTIIEVVNIIEILNTEIRIDKYNIKKIISKYSIIEFNKSIDIKILLNFIKNEDKDKITYLLKDILDNNECYSRMDLDINGNDLISLGYSGKEVGILLEELLDSVLRNNSLNHREKLLELIKR